MKHPSSKGLWVKASLIVIGKPLWFIVLDAPLMIDIFILTSCFFSKTSCMLQFPHQSRHFGSASVVSPVYRTSSIDRSDVPTSWWRFLRWSFPHVLPLMAVKRVNRRVPTWLLHGKSSVVMLGSKPFLGAKPDCWWFRNPEQLPFGWWYESL